MRNFATCAIFFLTVSLTGCINSLYQAETAALDTAGNERNFILYWTNTEPWIGTSKAGPAVLLTECSSARPAFVNTDDGIIFFGLMGYDQLPDQSGLNSGRLLCGKIENYTHLREIRAGSISVTMRCKPTADDFSVGNKTYLAPRPEPYVLKVLEKERQWSFLGKSLAAPLAPECRSNGR